MIFEEDCNTDIWMAIELQHINLDDEIKNIEEQQDIDIQNIEEFEIDINNYIQTNLGAFKTRKMDVAFLFILNDLIQAVKQLDRKIREER